jgi:hypothetical protein
VCVGGVLGDESVDQLVEEFGSEEDVLIVLYKVHPSYRILELWVTDVLRFLEAYLFFVLWWEDISEKFL